MNSNNDNQPTVVFGWGSFKCAAFHIARIGNSPLVLTGKVSARQLGLLDCLSNRLKESGCEVTIFEGISDEADTVLVNDAAQIAVENQCDVIVGLGGGAVLDAAKAAAATARNGLDSWTLTTWGRKGAWDSAKLSDPLPIVAIPTISGPGSEANGTAVLFNSAECQKAVLVDDRLKPCLAIIDPSLTVTVDPVRSHSGATDIIAHGIEDFLTQFPVNIVQAHRCLYLSEVVLRAAERLLQDPRESEPRTILARLATEVWEGGYSNADTPWTLHAIAHVLGARVRVGHSFVIAHLLPTWLSFIRKEDPTRIVGGWLDVQYALSHSVCPMGIAEWDSTLWLMRF